MKWLKRILAALAVLTMGPLLVTACNSVNLGANWQTADRSSAGIAPDPAVETGAVVQVYAAA